MLNPLLRRAVAPVMLLLVAACSHTPVHYEKLSDEVISGKAGKVGVVMTAMPKPDTSFPGASCLLCMAAASAANSKLTGYTHTLSTVEVAAYREAVAKGIRADGADCVEITDTLDLKRLPDMKAPVADAPKKDFRSLKASYGVDELVVIEVTGLGVERHYSGYISNGEPSGYISGNVYIVDLTTNAYRWQHLLQYNKQIEGTWDEPPSFPAITNAYFEAIERAKDQTLGPLKR